MHIVKFYTFLKVPGRVSQGKSIPFLDGIRKLNALGPKMKKDHNRRKRMSKPVPIASIIPRLMTRCRKQGDFQMIRIFDIWDDAVGAPISTHAQPEAFQGKLLVVHVTDSTWMHQLQFLKADMIRQLNTALGGHLIEEIRFRVGPL
jgi:predicted nucleic acid-binding Zn ribbon protein